jgi:protein TonB
LPKQALSTLLLAPPPPQAAAQVPQVHAARAVIPVQLSGLIAPTAIPHHIAEGDSAPSTPPGMDLGFPNCPTIEPGVIYSLGSVPSPPVVTRPKPSGPLRISAGVAEGHLLVPIQPVYPAIAKAAHVQGTVTIEAMISKQGLVENVHVVSGPPLLVQAALAGVGRARYVPFKLNGDPIEVNTTINIVFTMDN